MAKLWLITQKENTGYDTYSDAVVVAATEEEAKGIHPSGDNERWEYSDSWATSPERVVARLVGEATADFREGVVVCASFKAG